MRPLVCKGVQPWYRLKSRNSYFSRSFQVAEVFEVPADATDDEIAYLESLVPRLDAGLLELFDPATGELVFSCRPELREPTVRRIH